MRLWIVLVAAIRVIEGMTLVGALEAVCAADEVIYFLVGPPSGTAGPRESAVIPLSVPQDIQHARDLIVRGQNAGAPMVLVSVGCGKDGINRNYFDPTFPEWSWHVVKFNEFGDVCAEGEMLSPSYLELLFRGCQAAGTNGPPSPLLVCWSTVVRELGPTPLAVAAIPEGETLQLYWSAPGTNYVFTLESSESLIGTNWLAIPEVSWRLATNHWSVPVNTSLRFYRVNAASAK